MQDFFYHLAERKYRENDLSDITWAMCNAVRAFASTFVHFSDPSVPIDAAVDVEREVDLGDGCRIDFACRTDSATVFIEAKIYDQNYHIHQYAERVAKWPGSRLVLLTNHLIDPIQRADAESRGWAVRYWHDFAQQVNAAFPDNQLIGAYLTYLKRACNMIEWQDIRLDPESLYSLVPLHALLEETIGAASHDCFSYDRYPSQREHGVGWTGAYFQLNYREGDVHRKAWGFFGLGYEQPGDVQLEVWFDRDWNAELLKRPVVGRRGETQNIRSDGHGVGIAASESELKEFLRLPLGDQRKKLASLFQELMKPIEDGLASTAST